MAKKIYDIAVATGKYTNKNGEEKNRYENIGAVIQGDSGPFMVLKRTFNPAGIASDKDTILCSLFKADDAPKPQPVASTPPVSDEEIPF